MIGKMLSALLVFVAPGSAALSDTASAGPGTTFRYISTSRISSGVVFRMFQTNGFGGPILGYLLVIDLRDPHVTVGLLHPPVVAARAPVTAMANAQGALAGVNGDFFNIGETHAGVAPTGSAVGPEVADGHDLKAAVPDGQRFGPMPPAGTSTEDVIGIGTDRVGRVASLHLTGTIRGDHAVLAPSGLNQYALPVGGIGVFTSDWGPVPRIRAVCGTDVLRRAPCSAGTAEVTVRRGVVTSVGDAVGAGPIPPDTIVLVGREQGADSLRDLRPGDPLRIRYHLAGPRRFRVAVGGLPILRDGMPLAGLDVARLSPRTAAGVSRSGRRMYLVVVDGRSEKSGGTTIAGLAALLRRLGADDAMDLDGGGSSTLALRVPGRPFVAVRNRPSVRSERAVANGIGVFAHR